MPPESGTQSEAAREVFAGFLLRQEEGRPGRFEDLVHVHPELEAELAELHKGWQSIASVLRSVRERGGDGPAGPARKLLERLIARGGAQTRYRFEGELARGGMGAILKVWDEDLRRHLAMKVVLGPLTSSGAPTLAWTGTKPAGGAASATRVAAVGDAASQAGSPPGAPPLGPAPVGERALSRFLVEAQVTGRLEHPGIVPVHELGLDEDGRVYFTMRLVQGRDLKQVFELVKTGSEDWSRTRALGVILRVCEAMAFAHENRVIHRDLKPSNVMVGRFGEVYVMDWGLARVLGESDDDGGEARALRQAAGSAELTREGDVVGTPAYMSPEQAHGDLDALGPASDVYSLGSILYQLLAGHMPYAESGGGNGDSEKLDGRAVLEALKQRPPRPLRLVAPDVAPELVAICERAMERDPRERYAGMEEMASDLRAYLEGRVVRAYQSGPLAELEKWVLRNKGTAAATAAAVLAVIAGLGVALGIQSTAKREQGRLNEELKGTNTELEGANARLVSEQDRNRVLLDYRSAQVLVAQADELYPATPERIPDFERWLEPAEELLARDQRHAALLAAGDFERYGLRASDALSFRAELEHLRELLPNVSARLATARSLERLTLIDAAPLWERAVAEVAASPLYAGATLEPELGLVPLGANEQGYQEFWHVLSGTRPEHHPRGPGFDLATESGMVLVFLPGGSFTMGSPEDEPGRNQTEDLVAANVAPFFLSKYETTQAQYERAMGTNPSFYFADREGAESYTPTNPVESITWLDARELARRLALTLPLESEWESGCRGGTRTRFHTGDHPRTLVGFENLNDEAETMRFYSAPEDWHDGFSRHAPVGSFPPNPFGLHDVHGNVQEWCANIEESDASGRARVIRGGSWYSKAHEARSTVSWLQYERVPNVTVGVRLALAPNRD